jgi:hypothetical protein
MKQKMLAITIIFIFIAGMAFSQTFLFHSLPQNTPTFSLRYLRPDFDRDTELTLLSGVYDLTFNVPVSPTSNVVGSIPFSSFGVKNSDTERNVGNLYLGYQAKLSNTDYKQSVMSLGVFLPTAPTENTSANFMGLFSNYYQIEKYVPEMLTLYGNYTYRRANADGALFGLEIGPNIFIPTGADDANESELFLHYGVTGGFQLSQLTIYTELTGIGLLTENDLDAEDRFSHFLALGAHWNGKSMHPGIYYEFYLDEEMKEYWHINGVFGLKLDASF